MRDVPRRYRLRDVPDRVSTMWATVFRRANGGMLRRLLLLAFVAFAVLGLRTAAFEAAVVAEGRTQACCPCDDDDGVEDGCCSSAQCRCFAGAVLALPPRPWVEGRLAAATVSDWVLGSEQRARDRSSAPPIRPPIG